MHAVQSGAIQSDVKPQPSRSILSKFLVNPPQLTLERPSGTGRDEAESFVSDRFLHSHNANICTYLPNLLTMRCFGKPSAVAGIGLAGEQRLFLEQYLNQAIELELERVLKTKVDRFKIAEVGNLAANPTGASVFVFIAVAATLQRAGIDWMAFTITSELSAKFEKLGFNTTVLGDANIGRLDASRQRDWGTYYQNNPMVTVGRVSDAIELISSRRLFSFFQDSIQEDVNQLAIQLLA